MFKSRRKEMGVMYEIVKTMCLPSYHHAMTSEVDLAVKYYHKALHLAVALEPPLDFVETHALGHRTYAS